MEQYRTALDVFGSGAPSEILGQELGPKLYGRLIADSVDEDSPAGRALHVIPSETTPAERKFLFNYFRNVWKGDKNVLEIGPFLGGTTLAIGTGMMLNSSLEREVRFFTFDKFSDYYDRDSLIRFLTPILESGLVPKKILDGLGPSTSFKTVFDEIHCQAPYAKILLAREGVLPDSQDEPESNFNLFQSPIVAFNTVFVDGCKGWYQTRYFLENVVPHCQVGSHFIFQDYAWRTCFWIPMILEMLQPAFRLIAYLDSTYTFELTTVLTSEQVRQAIPAQPEEISSETFFHLTQILQTQALERSDTHGFIIHGLQYAASLAYIGLKDEARKAIEDLSRLPGCFKYRSLIESAGKNPAYNAKGPIYL